MATMRRPIVLTEPAPVLDDFCSGLARIDDIADTCARFVLFQEQTLYETGDCICVPVRKIVLPYSAVIPALSMCVDFMSLRVARQGMDALPFKRR